MAVIEAVRVAVTSALSEGEGELDAVAVSVADSVTDDEVEAEDEVVTDALAVADGEIEADGVRDGDSGVDEGVPEAGVREAVSETTGKGGTTEGAGTPLVASDGEMVAFAQTLSAAKVGANSADEAAALA